MARNAQLELRVDAARCVRCGACERVCPSRVFRWRDDRPEIVHGGRCIACGHCVAVCPHAACDNSLASLADCRPLPDGSGPTIDEVRAWTARRRSCRRFAATGLERGRIEEFLALARTAPSSTNSQNVRLYVLPDRAAVERLTAATCDYYLDLRRQLENPLARLIIGCSVGFKTVRSYRLRMPAIVEMFERTRAGEDRVFYGAPAAVVLGAVGLPHLALASANLAAAQLLLGAEACGLGAFYNGYALTALIRSRRARRALGLPPGLNPAAVIGFGVPDGGFARLPPRDNGRTIWL